MFSLFDAEPASNGGSEGKSHRDEVLALLRIHRADTIRQLQFAAQRVPLESGEVCADDCRSLVPIPPGISPKVVGAAFRELADAGFLRRSGFRNSTRPIAHARPLSVWQLADAAGASAWLAAHALPLSAEQGDVT